MIKAYCDICENEIKKGEFIGTFQSMEHDLSGKQGVPTQPIQSEYQLCQNCKDELKQKVAEMVSKKKKK